MEIKVGDKVRLTENYEMAFGFSGEGVVIAIMDEYGLVALRERHTISWISLCDLIKVEEAKEPKFKVNDVVRTVFNETTHITSVLENGNYYLYGMGNEYPEDSLTLVEPYTEPTEQTEAEKPNVGSIKIPVEVGLTDGFWDAYTADLAKEIALKVANKYNDPEEAAEYAVSVAKAVAEELKRK